MLSSLPPPSKKRKVHNTLDRVQDIKQLEVLLTRSVANNESLNPLADLLDLALGSENPQITSKAIYALYRVFVLIINNDKLGSGGDGLTKVVKTWLWDKLTLYVDFLASLLKDEEKTLRTSSLQILFSLQKHLSTSYSKNSRPQFHISHFRRIVSALLLCPPSNRQRTTTLPENKGVIEPDVLDIFYETWFSVHDDIRYFFLRDACTMLQKYPPQSYSNVATNLLSILTRLTTFPTDQAELNSWWVAEMGAKPPKPKVGRGTSGSESSDEEEKERDRDSNEDDDDWRKFFEDEPLDGKSKTMSPALRLHKMTIHQSLHSLASHKAVFTRTWLTLLPQISIGRDTASSNALATAVLNIMHRGVIPHLTRPVLIMDWVGAAVDIGGSTGLLALNALFVLIKEYNLDYPSFYTRLYAFLDRDLLHSKHRARFFRLTELFLSSTHLPATLLASFIKRLSILSLSAPPAAIIMIIPFTYNILKRHPALMTMIHREQDGNIHSDPFLPEEVNPLLTQALESSLWELLSHRSHYHSSVSTLCKIFSEAFTKPGYAMEDFLDHTYATLFDTEARRKIKKDPALAMERDQNVMFFPVNASADGANDDGVNESNDLICELWTF